MTAFSRLPKPQQPIHAPAALPNCSHSRMHFGLDRAYCPDCKRGFRPNTAEYKALLNEASTAMVAQALAKECLKANITESSSEAQPDTGQAKKSLNANCRVTVPTITADEASSGVASSKPTPEPKTVVSAVHWVEVYPVKQGAHHYYRYRWLDDPSNIRSGSHLHIKGGHTKSAIAIARKQQVEAAIHEGRTTAQIKQLIASFTA